MHVRPEVRAAADNAVPPRSPRPDWTDPPPTELSEVAFPPPVSGDDPGEMSELARWMGEQEGVHEVHHDLARGALLVRHDERQAPVRMLRGAVLDRLAMLRPKTP